MAWRTSATTQLRLDLGSLGLSNLRRDELDDWFAVMSRRDGMHVLHSDSAFVTDHRAQGERPEFARLYRAHRDEITFTVTGAEGDVLEGRQTLAAQDRLGAEGLDVRLHPGGHLTTHEHPDLLARTIRELTTRTDPEEGPSLSPRHLIS